MRYYTYSVGTHLLRELQATGVVAEILHDGSDIIYLRLFSGERVLIYLIERVIPSYEIRMTLADNTAAGNFTLFLVWCEMHLPDDDTLYAPGDWMETLMAVYGGSIYGYDVIDGKLFVFPVHFERQPYQTERIIHYGDPVDVGTLHCGPVQTGLPHLTGVWRIADFGGTAKTHTRRKGRGKSTVDAPVYDPLAGHYALLGLERDADRAAVKRAYRTLARRYHPDMNGGHDTHDTMQRLNVAYDAIMHVLDGDR